MLNKLKKLIFGLDEFEKTKIEMRFDSANEMIDSLQILKVEDFEILEDVIYKIKDELRVKSSNLNKVINDPKRKLRKRDVLKFLDDLSEIKYEFLKVAFGNLDESLNEDAKTNEIKKEQTRNVQSQDDEVEDLKIFENEDVKMFLENGKTPYILMDFQNDVDLAMVNKVLSIVFEDFNAHGTNAIIENNRVLAIPRFDRDNLIDLPRQEIDLDEVFNNLVENQNSEVNSDDDKVSASPTSTQENYKEISELKPEFEKSLKKKEDSLDNLLEGIEEKKEDFSKKPNPKEDKSKPEIIEDEPVKVIKEKKEIKNDEIEEIKEDANKKYVIYQDEKIIAYLKKDSKILGELIIENLSGENFSELDESTQAYVFIFTKVFSSILFDTVQAHGTNLILDYSKNLIRIIPRFENDGFTNLTWEAKSNTNEFLEQVRNKLLSEMSNADNSNETENKPIEDKEIKPAEKENTHLEEKAKFILDSLRRIP